MAIVSSDQLDLLASKTDRVVGTMFLTYDANGNLDTKTGNWDYDWNLENLMTVVKQNGAQQQAYAYDGLGRRIKTLGNPPSTWTASLYGGADPIFERDRSGVITKYVFANGLRVAKITPSGAVAYYLGDALGSTRRVLDASRTTVFSTDYEPFGKPVASSGAEAYTYTSEKHDDPTGLVYLRARQYDPEIGRFLSADPVLGHNGAPQTLNRYAYVVNNPLRYTDPTGKDCSWNPFTWGDCASRAGSFLWDSTVGAAQRSIDWYMHASDQDRWAFWAGVLTAVAIGVVIGASCVVAACAGLVLLAVGVGTGILGSFVAPAVYTLAGGKSEGGLEATSFWGGIGAGIGFGGGYAGAAKIWNAGMPRVPLGPKVTGDSSAFYRLGTTRGSWYSSRPFGSLSSLEAEFGRAARPFWQSTYRLIARFGDDVMFQQGPRGATGALQFRVFSGSPSILSAQLYTLAPAAVSGISSFAGAFSSRIVYYAG